ncbi:hypothetical protein SAMN04489724_2949 [Algoriphagus locisalis]|uniref:Uncharacterized protein n=1 Tax=Algoriphagus locisalis TaxID=305507 RepID=A0A1I7C850_9BACT|nr:hypothetical protein [Algoriphagus locisalis]SFT95575.1 hypothetical protein SAMN04489724_2949 [Algoriphagus locisalis]
MRQLSEQEFALIHARLKSLNIRYIEVYEEIFDHYCTTLENVPALDSQTTIAKLNETFACSVVKNMDKELEKSVSKQVWIAQLEFLKFWKHGVKGILIGLVGFFALAISILLIPASELILVFLVLIFCTTGGIYFMKRDAMNFSFQHKSVSVSSIAVIKRVGLLNSLMCWIWIMPIVLSGGNILSNNFFAIGMAVATILSIIYSISLIAVASRLPKSTLL